GTGSRPGARAWDPHRRAWTTTPASRARWRTHPRRRAMARRAARGGRRPEIDMTWRRERWSADHSLPIGVTKRAQVGELVRAGDIIAAGATLARPPRVAGARRPGPSPSSLHRA